MARPRELHRPRLFVLGARGVLDHFRAVFAGTWRFEPDRDAIKITPLGPDTAHIFAPTRITVGTAGESGTTYSFLVNEIAARTTEGWRITTIIPVPAQQ